MHGPGASPAREWYFAKRILDRRPVLILDGGGRSVDHTTAAANLASLVRTVASKPGARILNCGDPDAPSTGRIADAVARWFGCDWPSVRLLEDSDGPVGRSPWSTPHPIVLDMTAAHELGYVPAGSYAETVADELAWITAEAARRSEVALAGFGLADSAFDYASEDAFLR